MLKTAAFIIAASLCASSAFAAAGDAYVYRISNGYNNEVRAKLSFSLALSASSLSLCSLSLLLPLARGSHNARKSILDGNWLRHPLASHDQLRDLDFAKPLPVYVPPANEGNSWSVRVDAVEPGSGRRNRRAGRW